MNKDRSEKEATERKQFQKSETKQKKLLKIDHLKPDNSEEKNNNN